MLTTSDDRGIPDDELRRELQRHAGDRAIRSVSRRPSDQWSSFLLEEVRVEFTDGETVELVLKELRQDRLVHPTNRPEFLYHPAREIETYRRILADEGIGPRCYAAVTDPDAGRSWIAMERLDGWRLGKIGDFSMWEEVARWIARMHARFEGRGDELLGRQPTLLVYDAAWYRTWQERAIATLERSEDRRATDLLGVLERYDDVVDALLQLPRTFLHGELYGNNVMVPATSPDGAGERRVVPIDWEVAAIGPRMFDLAALTAGWRWPERRRLFAAYRQGCREVGERLLRRDAMLRNFHRCRLATSLQWLGWRPDHGGPPDRGEKPVLDWIGEALRSAERLELSIR